MLWRASALGNFMFGPRFYFFADQLMCSLLCKAQPMANSKMITMFRKVAAAPGDFSRPRVCGFLFFSLLLLLEQTLMKMPPLEPTSDNIRQHQRERLMSLSFGHDVARREGH